MDCRPLLLRRRASRPQLKRDPLGGRCHRGYAVPDRRIPYLLGLIALAIAGALLTRAKPVGTRSSTLSQPDLFMRGAVREDLTRVANRLFRLSFSTIVTQPESLSRATMLPGAPPTPVPADVDSVLRRHGFTHTGIKPSDSVAVFVSIRGRTAYRYTYSTRPLGPPYTGRSTLIQSVFSRRSSARPTRAA